ncbi:MAG: class I SAM-dependent methyltransferase [Nanoarchaeota archaeon]
MFNKQAVKTMFLNNFQNLFSRGEMLKAEKLINHCVPIELEDDLLVLELRKHVGARMSEIRSWNIHGRPKPESYATLVSPLDFPKFALAHKKIKELRKSLRILDIGCYTGDFIKLLSKEGHDCSGVDIHKDLMHKLNSENNGDPNFIFSRAEEVGQRWGEEFDVVVAMDVLEHCLNVSAAVNSIESVAKKSALIMINLPVMEEYYTDEAYEHLRMFSERQIIKLFGSKKNFNLETCYDELGRKTNFITYNIS